MLRAIDVAELVAADADDYVSIALRIAQDAAWRESVVQRISAGRGRLFHDASAIRALERFLAEQAEGGSDG